MTATSAGQAARKTAKSPPLYGPGQASQDFWRVFSLGPTTTCGRPAPEPRGDGLGGILYIATSSKDGRTWPEYANATKIPNPGSKATLYSLGGDNVALLHNPNSKHRSPLALWISFDGMKTWPYQRVVHPESVDGPKGRINYPDGYISADKQWLHFAFDDNRHRAVHYSAKLPPLP